MDGVLLLTDDAFALVLQCWTVNVPVIDITGAPDVDGTVANHLVQTVDACRAGRRQPCVPATSSAGQPSPRG